MNTFSFRSIIIYSIIVISVTTAQETFTLEYKFNKGKTYRYRTITSNSIVNEMMGVSTPTNTTGTIVSKLIIEDILPNRSFVIVALVDSFLSVANGVTTPGLSRDIIGKRAKLIVSSHGAIEQRKIIDSITVNGFDMNKMQFNNLLLVLPEKNLSPGSTWTAVKIDTMVFFGISMITTTTTDYNILGSEKKNDHDCIMINYKATSTVFGEGSPQGMKATANGKSTVNGNIYFDVSKGFLVAEESTTNGNIAMDIESGMSIAMTTMGKMIKILAE